MPVILSDCQCYCSMEQFCYNLISILTKTIYFFLLPWYDTNEKKKITYHFFSMGGVLYDYI